MNLLGALKGFWVREKSLHVSFNLELNFRHTKLGLGTGEIPSYPPSSSTWVYLEENVVSKWQRPPDYLYILPDTGFLQFPMFLDQGNA